MGNIDPSCTRLAGMNAYFWHDGGRITHYIRAESEDQVRERIALTHGADIAERAVIKHIATRAQRDIIAA
jgi:hypothetical protein